jgi:hypothetical protein
MKFTKLNYCQYLLSSQINYTMTNLAEHLENITGLTQLAQAMARLRRAERLKTKL